MHQDTKHLSCVTAVVYVEYNLKETLSLWRLFYILPDNCPRRMENGSDL